MKFTYRQLTYIYVAAEKGSIAAAAESLRISQSSIGAAINRFEATFDVKLFVRLPSKGLNLTPSGRLLIKKIGYILSEAKDFEADPLGLKQDIAGEIIIGCFAPLAPHVLPSIVRALSRRHTNISVRVLEGDLRQVTNLLDNGNVEVILSYDLGLSPGVAFTKLCKAKPHAIFSENHPLANEASVTMQQLAPLPMVLLDLPESRAYFETIFLTVGQTPNVVLCTETYETVRSFVAADMGYSVLNLRPNHNQTYSGGRVVSVPITDQIPAPTIGVGTRFAERSSKVALEFINECQRVFSPKRVKELIVEPD